MSLKLEDHARTDAETAQATHGMPHSPRATFWAAGLAQIVTRPLDERDHACGNEVIAYPPLSKGVSAQPAYTLGHTFKGPGLQAAGKIRIAGAASSVISTVDRLAACSSGPVLPPSIPRKIGGRVPLLPPKTRSFPTDDWFLESETRPRSMRGILLSLFLCMQGGRLLAQDGIQGFGLKKLAPPAAAAAGIRDLLSEKAFQIQDDKGQTLANIWLRKTVPGSEKPSGPKGAVLFPFLADGELIGLLEFPSEGHDYRDQAIAKGLYTMRYGLQPVNGDHLGVSTYRDYSLLVPAAKDQKPDVMPRKQLEAAQRRISRNEPSGRSALERGRG